MDSSLGLSALLPKANRSKVTVHLEADGTAVVALKPAIPGLPARRAFLSREAAECWADGVARHHARVEGRDGSHSHSFYTAGPEEVSDGPR